MKIKSFVFVVVLLLVAAFAGAQNFSGSRFTATFNGPVSTTTSSNATNSNLQYTSRSGNVTEGVTVRTVDHDIPVNQSSSQFYRANVVSPYILDSSKNSDGYYQGHPYSYGTFSYTENGVLYYVMERFIVVDSRTAIFIWMSMPASEDTDRTPNNANVRWQDFEYTLNIQ